MKFGLYIATSAPSETEGLTSLRRKKTSIRMLQGPDLSRVGVVLDNTVIYWGNINSLERIWSWEKVEQVELCC